MLANWPVTTHNGIDYRLDRRTRGGHRMGGGIHGARPTTPPKYKGTFRRAGTRTAFNGVAFAVNVELLQFPTFNRPCVLNLGGGDAIGAR